MRSAWLCLDNLTEQDCVVHTRKDQDLTVWTN